MWDLQILILGWWDEAILILGRWDHDPPLPPSSLSELGFDTPFVSFDETYHDAEQCTQKY